MTARRAAPRTPGPGPGTALPAGRSHLTCLIREFRTGRSAVVKTGGDAARLSREAGTLAALGAIPGLPCARLLGASARPSQPCLILAYIPGRHPRTLADYQAFGAALAILHNTPAPSPLRALAPSPAQLLLPARTLATAAAPNLAALLDSLTPPPGQPWTEPVLIHGDAAPANTLIHHRHGHAILIDFENTTIAHPGLDIGRAIYLTSLARAPARQRQARIDAVLTGYNRYRALPAHVSLWAATSGLQIAAWRHTHQDHARTPPWTIALDHARHWADF